jgi:single-stranded-DNA-specific exonuclease
MLPIQKHWVIPDRIPQEADESLAQFPELLRQILFVRGYSTREAIEDYLFARTAHDTDPFKISGVPEAASRIAWAIARGQKIAIYGDYDVDGVTATALLFEVVNSLGGEAVGYIPNRFDEGYGLNIDAIDQLKAQGVDLVVTVDCGIRSIAEAEHARQLGLDLIISDHHHPGKELPAATAIINPKQENDTYPDKNLSGVGLGYKLAQALLDEKEVSRKALGRTITTSDLLDLVALGTVADLAPLVGENRALVRAGLIVIRSPQRQGLLSLIGAAGLSSREITAENIGYVLGPRLNAAGRLESARAAFELLTTKDISRAGTLAQQLETQNRERQRLTKEIQEAAETLAFTEDPEALLLFAAHPDFNAGVVGLAASRLSEKYYRPAIVAQMGAQFTRGSCRSIPEFHITEALDMCQDLLTHHGGHAAAAGFTVKNENLDKLVERLKAIAEEKLKREDLTPMMTADAEIPLSQLTPDLLPYLELLEPTGVENPKAVFVSRDLRIVHARPVGKDEAHLKLALTDGWITYDAIAFRMGHWWRNLPPAVDVMYTYEVNEYNGRKTLQLNVRDLKPAGKPD